MHRAGLTAPIMWFGVVMRNENGGQPISFSRMHTMRTHETEYQDVLISDNTSIGLFVVGGYQQENVLGHFLVSCGQQMWLV